MKTPKFFTKNGWNLRGDSGGGMVYLININNPEVAEYLATNREFVARFKHGAPGQCARHFAKFLTANFTPVEYFAALSNYSSPLQVLESKGYVSYHVQKYLKNKVDIFATTR